MKLKTPKPSKEQKHKSHKFVISFIIGLGVVQTTGDVLFAFGILVLVLLSQALLEV